MIVVGICVANGGEALQIAHSPVEELLGEDDVIVAASGSGGICAAYNALIALARSTPQCELLVLIHDDVEVVDLNFRAKLLNGAALPGAGILGVVGGRGLTSLEWWEARETAGAVFETRGHIDLGNRQCAVDCVDGLLLALTPAAFRVLWFDDVRFPRFHGYDVDICLQARSLGFLNYVIPISVVHRTKGGYGDRAAFDAASSAISEKWPQFVVPSRSLGPKASRATARTRQAARDLYRGFRRIAVRSRLGSPQHRRQDAGALTRTLPTQVDCAVCGLRLSLEPRRVAPPDVVKCPECGVGITYPAPSRDVEDARLWEQRYGGSRLRRRSTWFGEAQSRIDWVKLYAPEGVLLEVGCGTGEFVATAQGDGYEASGVEPSAWAAARARELGVNVVTGFLSDWAGRHKGVKPDLVAMWHVLEHVPDPSALLKELHGLLRPGGLLFIEVPNFASTDSLLLGPAWDGLQPEDHFYHFDVHSMRVLLQAQNFEVEDLLEISPRIYWSKAQWAKAKNAALLERRPWPSLDYLRVVAVAR